MDINSKIKWAPGMVLSSQLLNSLNDSIEQHNIATKKSFLGDVFGILPGEKLSAECFFVKGNLEIPSLKCYALLPSGRFVNVDEEVVFPVSKLDDGDHYFCVGLADRQIEFEYGGTAMTRPAYEYAILDSRSFQEHDMIPVIRLHAKDGKCSIDDKYIAPYLLVNDDDRIFGQCTVIADLLEAVSTHENMIESRGKYQFMRYCMLLRRIVQRYPVYKLVYTVSGLAEALDYFIFSPNDRHEDIPPVSYYDIEKWFLWIQGYIKRAGEILDHFEVEKNELDINALKIQIGEDVMVKLRKELSETLVTELHDMLMKEMASFVDSNLKDFINGSFARKTYDKLKEDLMNELNGTLYANLYKALYDALYLPPEKEDDNFTPLI